MANATVNRQVNVYINSGEAAKAYDVLIKREKLLNAELAKTADPRRIKQLNAELDKLKDPIDRAAKKMKGELAPSIRELELATKKFLNEFKKTGSPEALANFQKFRSELQKAKGDLNGLETSSKGLTSKGIFSGAFWGSFLAGGVTAALSAMGNLFGGVIQEALDADAATKRLESTLNNLGRGDAFDRISQKADDLAKKFKYLDNDDIVAVFNKLIDYGKLTQKEMNDLLPVIINFAAKSKISIEESASIIIKAIEGNGKALKEYGINIKDAGSETERLNIIMTTLKEKTDGAGEAFQNSAEGGLATARQKFADIKEEIGDGVIPVLTKLLRFVSNAGRGLVYLGSQITTVFSDIGAFFDGGSAGFRENKADRAKKRQEAIDKAVINNVANEKSPEEIQKLIDVRYTQIQTLNELVRRGGMDAEAAADQVKDLRNEISQLVRAQDGALKNQDKLGIEQPDDKPKDKKSTLQKTKKEVDDLVKGIKDLGDVYEKTFGVRMADIAKGGKVTGEGINFAKGIADSLANITTNANRSTLAFLDLKVLTARGKQRLDAQLALLKEEERQKLLSTTLTENEKLLIEEQFRQKRKQAELEYFKKVMDEIQAYASAVINIFTTIGQANTDKENAELESDRRKNDTKKRNLERRLKLGLITELQYRREVERMDRELEKKEAAIRLKQFERNKREKLAQAIMNTAEAVTEVLPNLFLALLIGAVGAVQIATIASQKPPAFAEGGKLGGRSHSAGGNAVIDGSGRKIAEVEAGEGIVNKRTMADRRQYSVSGTPGQIISRLNSMYGVGWEGGATLVPGWRSYNPQRMNYAAMKGVYAAGGTFDAQNTVVNAPQDAIFENLSAVLSNMQATLDNLQKNGIAAYTLITQHEKQEERLADIRRDATMVG